MSVNNEENKLTIKNEKLNEKILEKIKEIRKKREENGYIDYNSYEINKILDYILEILRGFDDSIKTRNDIELTFVDRNKFDADLCIKIPSLLKKYKKDYQKEVVPKIIDLFGTDKIIKKVEQIGIYVNITLTEVYLFSSLKDVFSKYLKYGENNLHKGENIIVDYSSPNVAKHLHAGHIRSTIIGHVLSNLYDACGYYTHRINHINDWGGFGFLIEGYDRWKEKLKDFQSKNDMLFFIYTIYRKGEKVAKSKEFYDNISKEDILELKKYYGDFEEYNDFYLLFEDFLSSGKKRFINLENGKNKEIEIWEDMVKWSLEDFNNFYDLLGIKLDYLIGESFYGELGVKLVMDLEKKGLVKLYNNNLADEDIERLDILLKEEKITEKDFQIKKDEILKDIGAYVILLENMERFVVLKGDKSSIYATRDLGALKYRYESFSPSRMVYEVGQEQSDHFNKLFESAEKIGIRNIKFSHVYHGFYVDSETKKKLSSRDGASNVQNLIKESINYFKQKYKESDFSEKEIDEISYKLAIGSIIFNDIKSDKKSPVLISTDIKKACIGFEESGGAYVMYSIVRAKSILEKIKNLDEIKFEDVEVKNLDNIEKIIINEINKYSLVVDYSQENDNPSSLVEYVLNLSRYYNSYYNSHRVIKSDGEIIKTRIFITKAFLIVATNAMKLCHIEIPSKI